jgi:predicted permease
MPPLPAWRRYLRFWGQNVEADVDDELAFHLEMRAREKVKQGIPPSEAQRLARQRFGDIARVRRDCAEIGYERLRSERRRAAAADLAHDARHALRVLWRQKLAAGIIILCLALGIGSTTTVFTVGDALLLRPLPFPNGPRLVSVSSRLPEWGTASISSFEDFTDWRTRQHTFTALGASQRESYTVVREDAGATRIPGASVTSGLFAALGIRAYAGRLFVPSDDEPGAERVAVLSARLAQRLFGSAEQAVGATLPLNDRSYGSRTVVRGAVEVVGVLPAGPAYPEGVEIWTSMPRAPVPEKRATRSLDVIGATRELATVATAERDLSAISAQMARENPDTDAGLSATVRPLRDYYVGAARPAFAALAVAAGLLLVIACANVASLQLARASSRVREVAVRTALGAARGRVVRLLLTESVMLAVLGGAIGVALAYASNGVVATSIPARRALWMSPTIDARVLAFTVAMSALCGIAFGIAPALRLSSMAPARMLHGAGGSRAGFDPRRMRLQRVLVAAEVAISLVLMVASAMAAQSFSRMTRQDPGYDPAGVATFRLSMRSGGYDSAAARARLAEEMVNRLTALPNVEAAAAASHLPIADCCSRWGLQVEGEPPDRAREHMVTGNIVTPQFFRVLRIGLVRGRVLSDADRRGAAEALVISETFERELFKGRDAVGKVVHIGSRDAIVVGVVRDIKQTRLVDKPEPQFYQTQAQIAWDDLTFAVGVRNGASPMSVIPEARRILRALDPSLPLYRAMPMTELMDRAVAAERMFRALLLGFAIIALILATAGIYGVMSYFVAQRTAEMGIRMALGAHPVRLLRLVVRQGAVVAIIGTAIGLVGAALASRQLTRLLWGVSAREPLFYASAAGVLIITAVIACVGPARRAIRADPLAALRAD